MLDVLVYCVAPDRMRILALSVASRSRVALRVSRRHARVPNVAVGSRAVQPFFSQIPKSKGSITLTRHHHHQPLARLATPLCDGRGRTGLSCPVQHGLVSGAPPLALSGRYTARPRPASPWYPTPTLAPSPCICHLRFRRRCTTLASRPQRRTRQACRR